MICPECGSRETGVKDSRRERTTYIRRRRVCFKCYHRFTTYERAGRSKLRKGENDMLDFFERNSSAVIEIFRVIKKFGLDKKIKGSKDVTI